MSLQVPARVIEDAEEEILALQGNLERSEAEVHRLRGILHRAAERFRDLNRPDLARAVMQSAIPRADSARR